MVRFQSSLPAVFGSPLKKLFCSHSQTEALTFFHFNFLSSKYAALPSKKKKKKEEKKKRKGSSGLGGC